MNRARHLAFGIALGWSATSMVSSPERTLVSARLTPPHAHPPDGLPYAAYRNPDSPAL